MADFLSAVARLLKFEGGFSPRDNTAGAVNYGLTASFLRSIGKPYDVESIRRLSQTEAIEIYRTHFWVPLNLGDLQSQKLAELVLNLCVNCGPSRPVRWLQHALKISVDGIIGSKTISAANALASPQPIIDQIAAQARARYEKLAKADPMYAACLSGWLSRLDSLSK